MTTAKSRAYALAADWIRQGAKTTTHVDPERTAELVKIAEALERAAAAMEESTT